MLNLNIKQIEYFYLYMNKLSISSISLVCKLYQQYYNPLYYIHNFNNASFI